MKSLFTAFIIIFTNSAAVQAADAYIECQAESGFVRIADVVPPLFSFPVPMVGISWNYGDAHLICNRTYTVDFILSYDGLKMYDGMICNGTSNSGNGAVVSARFSFSEVKNELRARFDLPDSYNDGKKRVTEPCEIIQY